MIVVIALDVIDMAVAALAGVCVLAALDVLREPDVVDAVTS